MKGYKAFNSDLTCRGFQFEIGKTYEYKGYIEPCWSGFHFCKNFVDCYEYYDMSDETRICEVEAVGNIKTDDEVKYCTDKITILAEVKKPRLKSNLSDSNSGYCNSGNRNSGNWNSGDSNSGNRNSGNNNSGDSNSGNWNSGDSNSGNWNSGGSNSGNNNSGDSNSGNWNSGDSNSGNWNSGGRNSGSRNSGNNNSGDSNSGNWNLGNWNSGGRNSGSRNSGNWNSGGSNSGDNNSGNRNSGYWNSGNWNSGIFNTEENPKIKIFDKESDWTIEDWLRSKTKVVMDCCPCSYSDFIDESYMTDEEKERHPEYKTIGGYIKTVTITKADRQKWWDDLTEEEKEAVKGLPNFDVDKFKECTGITI